MADGSSSANEGKVSVKKAVLAKAIRAIKQVVAKRSASANPLFDSASETMTLMFTLAKVPEKRKNLNAALIPLPHPLYDDKSEVCFISKDPQKKFKELLLEKHPTPGLTKVISVGKLRQKYSGQDAKIDLSNAFDLFLCDKSVNEMLPQTLGNAFYKQMRKAPIPVKLAVTDPRPGLEKAIRCTPLRVPKGPCIGVRFGRVSMSEEQLVENAATVIAATVKRVDAIPFTHIAIHATQAPALPVWRRPRPQGELLDSHRDGDSSAASDTGASGVSETEMSLDTLSMPPTPLSTPRTPAADTLSELDTAGETHSELDSEAGDEDADGPVPKEKLPLVRGLKFGKKKKGGPAAPASDMAPPSKKAKRAKAGKEQ